MSGVMIQGGRTEAQVGEGFDFLPGTVIDQHFLMRRRIQRLLGVVRLHPELVGLGIDESTALVVDVKAKRIQVIGKSYVLACVAEPPAAPTAISESGGGPNAGPAANDLPKTISARFEILKPGDEADLSALRSLSPDAIIPGIDFEAL
jgi:cyanophycinase